MDSGEKTGQQAGEEPLPLQDDKQSEAVDRIDQSGQEQIPEGGDTLIGGGSEERLPMSGGQALMEQWLEQIEGDPAQLMQQQFRLEEYKYLRSKGGRDRETRPW
jgi:Ca-activated chloride channel family protein